MNVKRFEELKSTGLLPSPVGIGLEILRLSRDERSSATDIARVIQTDMALTGRVLKLANTGNAAASRPVTNVADAVARLGTRTVGSVALGFTVLAGNRNGRCRGFNYQRFWSHSLAYAVASQMLCSDSKGFSPSDGFTAGLLAQVGRLAFASVHPDQYAVVLAEWDGTSAADLVRREQKVFVTDHNELAAVMLADWGLPPSITEAVLHQDDPSNGVFSVKPAGQLARVLHAAAKSADICVAPSDALAAAFAADLLTRTEAVGIAADAVFALFDSIFGQWTDWARVLDVIVSKPVKLQQLLDEPRPQPLALGIPFGRVEAGSFLPGTSDDSTEAATADLRTADRPSGLLALVADADASSLQFLERFLVLSGHRVRCATTGREALQTFFETAPQLVLADSGLPDFGGLEFCRRLRQTSLGRQAYIVLMTAPDDEETLTRLFDAGIDDFVTKPFAARPLFARIRASLRVVALQERVNLDRAEIQRAHSDLIIAHRRLEQDALTDVLTGLPNRRYLIDRMAHDWAAARRGGTPLTCMVIDIDKFKRINDTYGHDVGDSVLTSVAVVLQREIRGADVVCRFGGEEFVVVSTSDFESSMRCAERLRAAIAEETAGQQTPVTVSIGVAVRGENTRSAEALLKAADEALFRAKREGRNRVAGSRERSPGTASSPRPDTQAATVELMSGEEEPLPSAADARQLDTTG